MIKKADEVIDDIKRQSENLVAELSRKESEKQNLLLELEDSKVEFDRSLEQERQKIDSLYQQLSQKEE